MPDYEQKHIKKNIAASRSDKSREPSSINQSTQQGFEQLAEQQRKEREARMQQLVQPEPPKPTQPAVTEQPAKKPETPQDIKAAAKKKQIDDAKKSKREPQKWNVLD